MGYPFEGGIMGMLLLILPIILAGAAQAALMSTYKKYSKIANSRNLTGAQVARRILDSNGLQNVQIYQGEGMLSDYFDPTKNLIKLSPEIYAGNSIASLAVAAHECGHAIQYAQKFPVIALRNKVLPLSMFASNMAWGAIMIGIFANMTSLLWIGIGLLLVIALFQLLTLPLEFDASKRALTILENDNFLALDEVGGAKRVLKSAALTYVVALITTLAQVLRLVLIARERE